MSLELLNRKAIVPHGPADINEEEPFLQDRNPWSQQRRSHYSSWMLSTFALALLSCLLSAGILMLLQSTHPLAFPTDISDAHNAVQYEQTRYTGSLTLDTKLRRVIRVKDGDIEYFGSPSPGLDRAWGELLKGDYVIHFRKNPLVVCSDHFQLSSYRGLSDHDKG